MQDMSVLDKALYVTQVLMQLALVVVPVLLAYWQKGKLEKEDVARAVLNAVPIVQDAIRKGDVAKGEPAKELALELAARELRKPRIKGRSLVLAEGVLEGEVHRLKSPSGLPIGG